MTWIHTVLYEESTGRLRTLYDSIKGPHETIDNIMKAHSLRPHSMVGHLALYKNILHHSANTLPQWLLECLGLYVSLMNGCEYCVDHHFEGMRRTLGNDERASLIWDSLKNGNLAVAFDSKERAVLHYAERLTRTPVEVEENDVHLLRAAGFSDSEILEANQVISYFAYANRMVQGLGVTTEGDILGLSPSNQDPSILTHR
jgi:uncharacterized peroxidase-related enzyme